MGGSQRTRVPRSRTPNEEVSWSIGTSCTQIDVSFGHNVLDRAKSRVNETLSRMLRSQMYSIIRCIPTMKGYSYGTL